MNKRNKFSARRQAKLTGVINKITHSGSLLNGLVSIFGHGSGASGHGSEDQPCEPPGMPIQQPGVPGRTALMKSLQKGLAGLAAALVVAGPFAAKAGIAAGAGITAAYFMACEAPTEPAIKKPITYTVKFVVDDETIYSETVEPGETATPPSDPTKEGYDFDGWDVVFDEGYDLEDQDADFTNVTGNITVTAKWKVKTQEQGQGNEGGQGQGNEGEQGKGNEGEQGKGNEGGQGQGQETYYTVTFASNGATVSTVSVKSGENAPWPATPTHSETRYKFEGWEGNTGNVTEDRTITAKWKEIEKAQEFTVTFLDGVGGNTIGTRTVNKGGNATPPGNPTKDGYTFDGWSGNYSNVQQNETVYAKWLEIVKEPQTIPAFNFDADVMNVVFPTDGISTGTISKAAADANIDAAIIGLYNQSKNLSAGYNAVADEYDAGSPIYRTLANKESAYMAKMKTVVRHC